MAFVIPCVNRGRLTHPTIKKAGLAPGLQTYEDPLPTTVGPTYLAM